MATHCLNTAPSPRKLFALHISSILVATVVITKRLAKSQQPNLYLEPKWLRYHNYHCVSMQPWNLLPLPGWIPFLGFAFSLARSGGIKPLAHQACFGHTYISKGIEWPHVQKRM